MALHLVSLIVLAFAVSVDGFGVGITYGLRRIRIPLLSVLIIACCSGLIILLSMQLGSVIAKYLSPGAASLIGAIVLMGIGCWALLQLRRNRHESKKVDADHASAASRNSLLLPEERSGLLGAEMTAATAEQEAEAASTASGISAAAAEASHPVLVVMVELKRIGLVIQILRAPQAADVDKSGTISASEAIMLGVALSLDAFGAGIGAAMIGLPALLTAIVIAAASALFLLGGISFGFRFSHWRGMQALAVLPGILLIMIGISKLL
ncbi:MntP/YtaF family protein [Paenibacillus sp. KS-LC4]|uniref:MntP/YtaF family protein n=1 Tax=Paenibacillus sp. KS-LC4 TaxID=2979727 RepID=UPI0030CDA93E